MCMCVSVSTFIYILVILDTVLYCTVLYCTVLYCTLLYYAVENYTFVILGDVFGDCGYFFIMLGTVLYCTVLQCTLLNNFNFRFMTGSYSGSYYTIICTLCTHMKIGTDIAHIPRVEHAKFHVCMMLCLNAIQFFLYITFSNPIYTVVKLDTIWTLHFNQLTCLNIDMCQNPS